MPNKTLTRVDLTDAVYKEIGFSRNESSILVDSVLDHITNALVEGEDVKLSSFGTFELRDKSARVGRNPKTGVEAEISARRVLSFRPSQMLRERVSSRSPD